MRRPEDALLVVFRPGPEYLVLLRSPAYHGYWHLVSGGLKDGEEPAHAALRELEEETALRPLRFAPLALELGYRQPEGREITVHPFLAEAPERWEPVLNEEHVDYRWLDAEGAIELLEYPEPREAVREVARLLETSA